VQDEEHVLDIVPDNPPASIHYISSATVHLFQRAAWCTVRENVVSFSFTTRARVAAGHKHLFTVSQRVPHKIVSTPHLVCHGEA
jgi:hypothetical protein